jgi:O-antigen/teichoic acid export membrane protein
MIKKLSSKELLFVKNLFLTTILGGIIGIINYFFNIFIARYTDSQVFSIFSSALGVIYLLQIPAIAIQAVITKGIAQNKNKDLNHYKWNSFLIFSGMGIIFSILFFLFKNTVADIASIPTETILFLAITFLFAFMSPVAKGLLLGLEKIVTVNIVLLLETILKFAIGIVAIRMGGALPLLILANSVPAILTTVVILPLIKFEKRDFERVKINYIELVLITLSILLLTAPFTVDLILVNPAFRPEYAAISLLGKLVYFASITTGAVMFARLTNESEAKNQRRSLMISLILSLSIGLFISTLFFIFNGYVVDLTVGSQYGMISKYIGVFGLCMTGFAFVYMAANFFISKGFFKYLYILFITTVLQILLFIIRNDSLDMVIQNQIFVYIFLSFATLIYLIIKLRDIKNGR